MSVVILDHEFYHIPVISKTAPPHGAPRAHQNDAVAQ